MPKIRLDQLVVERRLAPSRERARAMILAGQVRVGGKAVTKAGTAVDQAAAVDLLEPDHPYVGRGGLKLAHALDTFTIAVRGRECLDIGASTGGFTDVLLQRGAVRVVALDVGHGQIDWTLRNDPRVVVIERFNARHLTLAERHYYHLDDATGRIVDLLHRLVRGEDLAQAGLPLLALAHKMDRVPG